jgi:ATP-dependent DNA helicase RecG
MEWQREDEHTEYKTATGGLPTSIWETYSAFLNTDGGVIYLGVSEDKIGMFKTVGLKNAEKILSDFVNNAHNKEVISYNQTSNISASIQVVDELEVIKIVVPKATNIEKPVYIKGRPFEVYFRIGDADQRLTQAEINHMLLDAVENVDNRILENRTFKRDIDLNSFRVLRTKIEENEKLERYRNMSDEDFAYDVGITDYINADTDDMRLTMAGLLMVGKWRSIVSQFPSYWLEYAVIPVEDQLRYTSRIVASNSGDDPQNVMSFYLEVFRQIKATTENPFSLDIETGLRKHDAEDKLAAVRELLANSLVHAAYGYGRVIVKQYVDHFEFSNPGQLRVSEQQYRKGGRSDARNQLMMNLFRRAGLVESFGSGGRSVYAIAHNLGLKEPNITNDVYGTTIDFWKVSQLDLLGTQLRQDEVPYVVMLTEGPQSMKSLARIEASYAKRRRVVETLMEEGVVYKVGGSRNTQYVLRDDQNE